MHTEERDKIKKNDLEEKSGMTYIGGGVSRIYTAFTIHMIHTHITCMCWKYIIQNGESSSAAYAQMRQPLPMMQWWYACNSHNNNISLSDKKLKVLLQQG